MSEGVEMHNIVVRLPAALIIYGTGAIIGTFVPYHSTEFSPDRALMLKPHLTDFIGFLKK